MSSTNIIKGARAATDKLHKLIPEYHSKISLNFSEDFEIFCEGVWFRQPEKDNEVAIFDQVLALVLLAFVFLASNSLALVYVGLVGRINPINFVGLHKLIQLNGLIGHNELIEQKSLISNIASSI